MSNGSAGQQQGLRRPRAVFFGTPAFAVPALRALSRMVSVELSLVVTQPDRPAGRGQRVQPSPVKRAARELALPVYQPSSLRSASVRESLASIDPDVFIVAAYGQIFGPKLLALPSRGSVNLHASLLPAYRGASPVAAAILAGDAVTGISLMVMESGLDTGPVLATRVEPINADDTTESLTLRLADTAAEVLVANLEPYLRNELNPRPQGGGATMTRPLAKADGWLDWTRSAEELERHVRAMWSWPRAWTALRSGADRVTIQVHEARVVPGLAAADGPPGRLVVDSGEALVTCGRDRLALTRVQIAGGRPQSGASIPRLVQWSDGLMIGAETPLEDRPPLITRVSIA